MELTKEQEERYTRHLILDTIGRDGQEKLLQSKVLVIGAGGLGSPVSLYLAAAGVGTLGIVDNDVLDLSNLQRQIIHSMANIGKAKVTSAQERIAGLNGDVHVIPYNERMDGQTIRDVITDQTYDFVIDCTDNFTTKFLINDACVLLKKPFSHGGVLRFQGQTMTYVPGQGPCYRCLFEDLPAADVPTCKEAGVFGAVVGTIGTIQATEAVKYILGKGKLLTGYFLTYDGLAMEFRKIKIDRNIHCRVCGDAPTITALTDQP
ncbi:MAG: HesA/MoeB/ThiF family protein [Megasphaera sp.]|nr:HesA/MoeB/ThiF family protein [Megasphaera sp.]MCH4187761.1 HesA/MoeB/ThiF family protein [Megasphaera sp.]MCH4217814.1 HesA/MoeB/ThiF family protein [Megasphaera sp.]